MRRHLEYLSRQNGSDPISMEGWRRKSGAAETLTSHAGFSIRDIVRLFRIQLRFVSIRTPWLPPFVLCVCADDTSADRTKVKRGRRSSQAARSISYRRRISIFRTISRLSHTAWEVRVSAAPDFRLHYSIEFGSLPFCQLGYSKWRRTDPSKIPLQPQICTIQP